MWSPAGCEHVSEASGPVNKAAPKMGAEARNTTAFSRSFPGSCVLAPPVTRRNAGSHAKPSTALACAGSQIRGFLHTSQPLLRRERNGGVRAKAAALAARWEQKAKRREQARFVKH